VNNNWNSIILVLLQCLVFNISIWAAATDMAAPVDMAARADDFWDPPLYDKSCDMQRRWAQSLLGEYHFHLAERILDVGSGDGLITAGIAKKYPMAEVVGLDLSPKMVAYASRTHKAANLKFVEGDAQALPFVHKFDVVTSFSTIHRLKEPEKAIKQIYRALKPGGKFVAAFPVLGSAIMSEAIAAVDTRPEWQKYFSTPDRKAYAFSEEAIREWLDAAGFLHVKADTKWADEIYESEEKFRDNLRATFNQRGVLPKDKEQEFFSEVVKVYLRKFPKDEKGQVHFYFNRIEIVAVKPLARL